ncbi:hypothetical protein [Clostridium sp.]|uniref:hypothetical protein n=1 Tax=Clostridium sp. TaxID=1506 RepID=UPI0026138E3D|nr:hypothetical protein [Clostridium sp.]
MNEKNISYSEYIKDILFKKARFIVGEEYHLGFVLDIFEEKILECESPKIYANINGLNMLAKSIIPKIDKEIMYKMLICKIKDETLINNILKLNVEKSKYYYFGKEIDIEIVEKELEIEQARIMVIDENNLDNFRVIAEHITN